MCTAAHFGRNWIARPAPITASLWWRLILPGILGLASLMAAMTPGSGIVSPVLAQGPQGETITPGSHLPRGQVQVTVESRSDGVYLQISYRDSSPGQSSGTTSPGGGVPAQAKQPESSTGNSTSPFVRSWTDPDTNIYYSQTGDGTTYSLEPVNIGQASQGPGGWFTTGSQQYPNSTPYAFNVNGNFQSITWIPNNPPSVNWGPPPPAVNTAPPGGNGASTNPIDVALDALGHVPLPNIQLKANPGLGLVAMPSWFWVEGYDGSPFGTSRTVTIPPEVGPEVPITVVPASDPRRQPTSFTVSVRVWPSRYEWYFGDGATLVAQSLGKAYPAESDIQHTYEHSSLPFPSGFPLRLTVDYSAEFSVSTGGGGALPTITRTYEAAYPVQEVQPVLTHP